MTLTLKDLGLRFKRYDINHPSGPNFRAIRVTEENIQSIFRYIEASGHDQSVEYDPTKNTLYILQWRYYKLKLGGTRRKMAKMRVRPGDYVVQYHSSFWERLTNEEFQAILKAEPEFRKFQFGGQTLLGIPLTAQNGLDLVQHINRNGGRATVSARKPGDIRVYQMTSGQTWSKRDWRVASPGDYIIQRPNGEFGRILKRRVGIIEFDN